MWIILSEFFKDRMCPFEFQILVFFSFLWYFPLWYCFIILTVPFVPYSSSEMIGVPDLPFFHVFKRTNNNCSFPFHYYYYYSLHDFHFYHGLIFSYIFSVSCAGSIFFSNHCCTISSLNPVSTLWDLFRNYQAVCNFFET